MSDDLLIAILVRMMDGEQMYMYIYAGGYKH